MKHRAIVLALASASALLPCGAHAAEDFCSRLIIQAINQFCQLLPNGSSLCQPVALVGPSTECKTPERQAVVTVPLGPPTIQPLAPWASPYANRGLTMPGTATALSPFVMPPPPAAAAPMPAPAAAPETMAAAPGPVAGGAAAPADNTTITQTNLTSGSTATPPIAVAAASDTPPETPGAAVAPPVTAPADTSAGGVTPPPPHDAPMPATDDQAPVARTAPAVAEAAAPPPLTPEKDAAPSREVAVSAPAPAETPAPAPASATAPATPAEDGKVADALAHFDFDSATLTDAGRAVLDAWLAIAPKGRTIRVSGHADRLGPEPYNIKLSLRRAEAVKQYLIGKGMDARHIELVAKGELEPVTRCKGGPTPATKDCLAPNRRVVIDP